MDGFRRMLLVGAAASLFAGSATGEIIYRVFGHTGDVEAVDTAAKEFVDFGSPTESHTTHGIQFNLFYEDIRQSTGAGFDGANGATARQRVRDTLDVMANSLNESGELDVRFDVSLTVGGSGQPLASASSYYPAAAGFFDSSTFRRLDTGTKPFSNVEEMFVRVNFGFNWNFTAAATTGAEIDFMSVMLHEFTHALGVASLSTATGDSVFNSGITPSVTFTRWNTLLSRGQNGAILWSGAPPAFGGVAGDLTSGELFFRGEEAFTRYAQPNRPGVYAPNTFSTGSSLSHFDTGNIIGGAVMEHSIPSATDRREYSAMEIGALIDLGYANAATPEDVPIEGPVDILGPAVIEEGETLVLTASLDNVTALTYQWIFEGADLPGEENATLMIANVTLLNAGDYQLRVTDSSKATYLSPLLSVEVVPQGTLPLTGGLGLALLSGVCALSGAGLLRRRR